MFKPWKPIIQTLFFRKPVQTVSKHQLRNNRKLNLLTGRLKPCLKISLFIVIHFEMTWNRRTTTQQRVKRKREYANRRNIPVQQIPHPRDRFYPLEENDEEDFQLHFCLFWRKIFQHYTRRGLLLTSMHQVLIAFTFYTTGTFEEVNDDLFRVSVFATGTVIHKVSTAIAKRKKTCFLKFLRTWLIPRESFIRKYHGINNFWGHSKITVSLTIILFVIFSLSCE